MGTSLNFGFGPGYVEFNGRDGLPQKVCCGVTEQMGEITFRRASTAKGTHVVVEARSQRFDEEYGNATISIDLAKAFLFDANG